MGLIDRLTHTLHFDQEPPAVIDRVVEPERDEPDIVESFDLDGRLIEQGDFEAGQAAFAASLERLGTDTAA